MPTPNAERNSNLVEVNNDNITDLILMNSSDGNMETFTTIPLDFDSSNSSMETVESVEETDVTLEGGIPMLTDIAEETVYETEFFDENGKPIDKFEVTSSEDEKKLMEEKYTELMACDISNVPIEINSCDMKEDDKLMEITESQTNKNDSDSDNADVTSKTYIEDVNCNENSNISCSNSINSDENIFMTTLTPPVTEVSEFISLSEKNGNGVSNLIENVTMDNSFASDSNSNINIIGIVPSSAQNTMSTVSSMITVNSLTNKKISTFKPIAVQSATTKFVPISIAPANAVKRPANISVGQSSNVVTKVVVSQGKVGQPIVITNSPQKPRQLCLLPNPGTGQSPVKSITFAQAKQMGLIAPGKLQPIRPSTTSKDYLMKGGTILPKQQGGQVITISNLQPSSVISNHVSPKKQVQYIKLINNVGSTNMPTVTTTKGKITTLAQTPTVTKIDKDTPIIVASSNFAAANLNVKSANVQTTKSATGTTGITVLPMIQPNLKSTPGQRLILPAVSKAKSDAGQSLLTDSKQLKAARNLVVVSEDVLQKIKGELLATPIKLKEEPKSLADSVKQKFENHENIPEPKSVSKSPTKLLFQSSAPSIETGNGLRSRKPCNCTRSQCLKLYCECFANGEFCNNCNCVSCHNNISHEENRQHAIRSCLDRNPQAFRPKIGKCLVGLNDRRHTKGCHCKRSGCLKNYCECYEAQIPCSENCKCVGCKNVDDMLFATSFGNNFEKADSQLEFQNFSKNKLTAEINDAVGQSGTSTSPRHAFSFVKDQVVEATCQCLLAQAEEVKRRSMSIEDSQKYIIEEFGRCLIQIIECAKKSYDNIPEKYTNS